MSIVCCYKSNTTNDQGCFCQGGNSCDQFEGYTLTSSRYVSECPRNLEINQELQKAYENKLATDILYWAFSKQQKEFSIENEDLLIQVKLKKDISCSSLMEEVERVDYAIRSGYGQAGTTVEQTHQFQRKLIDFIYDGNTRGFISTGLTRVDDKSFRFSGQIGGVSGREVSWSYQIKVYLED